MANALLAKDPAETCVLVTGGAGFIGSHTVVELLERNYQVVIVDDLSNSSREAVRRVGEITGVAPVFADLPNEEEAEAVAAVAGAAVREVAPGPSLTFYEANILDRAALETIFTMHAVDVIIHFAGFKAVGESGEPSRSSTTGTTSPAPWCCAKLRASTAARTSCSRRAPRCTASRSSSPSPRAARSTTPPTPMARRRAMLEQMLTDLYVGDNEWNVVLLRYFNPIGAHESRAHRRGSEGHPEQPAALRGSGGRGQAGAASACSATTTPPLTAPACATTSTWWTWPAAMWRRSTGWPARVGTGEPIGVGSVAGEPAEDGTRRGVGIFNLGTGKGSSACSTSFTPSRLRAATRFPTAGAWPRRAGDIAECYADATKARDELGWTAEYDMARMCEDGWRWQSQNPDGYGDAE